MILRGQVDQSTYDLVAGQRIERKLMTPSEVAAVFRVDPKTVGRWAKAGRINGIRTPGGHHRFYQDEIMALLKGSGDGNQEGAA